MLDGKTLRDAIISGANNLNNQRHGVDSLNVFPVPDGDTGTNMSMTMNSAKTELLLMDDSCGVYEVAKTASAALLRGARGNSGVITSLLFRGFSKGLKGKDTATSEDIIKALEVGVASAYKAVMKPTEGTILTVARVASEKITESGVEGKTEAEVFAEMTGYAEETLLTTPDLLPVLKKAGVVDAGGKGLTHIYNGMLSVFRGEGIIPSEEDANTVAAEAEEDSDTSVSTYGYSLSFAVIKADKAADVKGLRAYLESIGNKVTVDEALEKVNFTVETDTPDKALGEALKLGMITDVKMENLVLAGKIEKQQKKAAALEQVEIDPEIPYGFVSVAAGEGVENLFKDLGVNNIVSGGQTMNPSTEDILSAIEATPSQTVFVLPNNKNIIMASEQAAKLSAKRTARKVIVVPTCTIPQGLSAMLSFDPESDADTNTIAMKSAADSVGTGQITYAARDSDYDGHKIKEGELLALLNGKVSFTEHDLIKCAVKLTKALLTKESSFVTLIYGSDVNDETAAAIEAAVKEKLPEDIDLALVNGGQPVYYLTISVE